MSAVYIKGVMGPETFGGQLCLIVLLVCRVFLVALFLAGGFGRHTSGIVLALDDGRRVFLRRAQKLHARFAENESASVVYIK